MHRWLWLGPVILFALGLSGCSGEEPERLADLFREAHRSYRVGNYAAALSPAGRAFFLAERDPGPDSVDAKIARRRLAHLSLGVGLHRSAEKLLTKILEEDRAERGEGHPSTILTMNNLAVTRLVQGRTAEARALLEGALGSEGALYDQRLVLLHNLTFAAAADADYGAAQRFREAAIAAARLEPRRDGEGRAIASAGWVLYVGRDGGSPIGPKVDCSMFVGGNGPFNPDPESGGPLADCGPFGSDPIFGDEDPWWEHHPGGPGGAGGGGDGGNGAAGGGGDGDDGSETPRDIWGTHPLTSKEKGDLPEGIEEDFNGCAKITSVSDRARCCQSVEAACHPGCMKKFEEELVWGNHIDPFFCMGCTRGNNRCKTGNPL